jgi:hypothetical protein
MLGKSSILVGLACIACIAIVFMSYMGAVNSGEYTVIKEVEPNRAAILYDKDYNTVDTFNVYPPGKYYLAVN